MNLHNLYFGELVQQMRNAQNGNRPDTNWDNPAAIAIHVWIIWRTKQNAKQWEIKKLIPKWPVRK